MGRIKTQCQSKQTHAYSQKKRFIQDMESILFDVMAKNCYSSIAKRDICFLQEGRHWIIDGQKFGEEHIKKSILSSGKKSKNKRTLKSERGIEGLSLQELLRKKNESAEQRKKAVDQKKSVKPVTKAAKKTDLNSRLRELRKKRKAKEEAAKNKEESKDKSGGDKKRKSNKGKGGQKNKGKKGKGKKNKK